MKKDKLQIISWILIFLLVLAFFVLQLVATIIKTDLKWFVAVGYAVLGGIITSIIASIIHELGHVLCGLIIGLKLYSFNVAFLKFSFNGKFKISFVKPNFFGETILVPKTPENYAKKFVISSIWGLVASLVVLAVGLVVAFYSKNVYVYLVFGLSYHVSAYLLLMNLLPIIDNNDGALILTYFLKDEGYKKVLNNSLNISYETMLGKTPFEVSPAYLMAFNASYDYFSVLLKYYRYLAFLWQSVESATKELYDISDLDKLPISLYEIIYKELFYVSILNGDDNYVKKHEDVVVGFLQGHKQAQDYRIHATYRNYKGDVEWAKLIVNSGITALNGSVDGLDKYEAMLLEKIKG